MYMALMESEECMERIACEVGGLVSDAGIQQEHDQDGWPVCAQEVHQDDEDLQPRQGLQEEQQVRSLLRWPPPLSVTIIQKHCNDNLRQRNLIAAKTSKSLFKKTVRLGPIKMIDNTIVYCGSAWYVKFTFIYIIDQHLSSYCLIYYIYLICPTTTRETN